MANFTNGVSPWNRALVTGASSGIGRDLCRLLANAGTDLVIAARREDRLQELKAELDSKVEVEVIVTDLLDADDIEALAERISAEERPIDLLINNAGVGHFGEFTELDLEAEKDVIQVNVNALHSLCYAAAKTMQARKRGFILNVSSISGFAPYPRSATYCGSKAFVTNFSEALQSELADDGVVVSALCPGPVRTEFQVNAKVNLDVLPDVLVMESEDVARTALEDLAKKKALIVPGIPMKLTRALIKVTPAAGVRWMSNYVSSKR